MPTAWLTTEYSTQNMVFYRNEAEQEFPSADVLTEDRLRTVFIGSLAPTALPLKQFIPVSLTETSDGYIASFVEANIHSSGESELEAIDNLRTLITDFYTRLSGLAPSLLGPMPAKQFSILRSFIQPS